MTFARFPKLDRKMSSKLAYVEIDISVQRYALVHWFCPGGASVVRALSLELGGCLAIVVLLVFVFSSVFLF